MEVQIFEFRWHSPLECTIEAHDGLRFGKKKVLIGDDITFSVCSGVSCSGHKEDGKWKNCPQQFIGRAKCDICRAREGSFIFTSFDGFDRTHFSEQDIKKISGNHYVYLALFDKDLIKVGVSGEGRKELRQLEQGSHLTLYIAKHYLQKIGDFRCFSSTFTP